MPRGSKAAYSDKQKRQAEHIEKSEKKQGRGSKAAERIAWATVNKQDGGAKGAKSKGKAKSKSTSKSSSTKSKSASTRSKTTTKAKSSKSSARAGAKKTAKR